MKYYALLMVLCSGTTALYSASAMTEQQVQDFLDSRTSKEEAMVKALLQSLEITTIDSSDIVSVTTQYTETVTRSTTTLTATLSCGLQVTATEHITLGKSVATCYCPGMNLSPESFYVIKAWLEARNRTLANSTE